jgi:hypothetical protein
MKPTIHIAVLVLLTSIASLAAGSWSGPLVDSKCYETANSNGKFVTSVDRDMELTIRLCAPNAKTESFGVVLKDWQISELDANGNAKASELIRTAGKQKMYMVTITGEMKRLALEVDSLSAMKE